MGLLSSLTAMFRSVPVAAIEPQALLARLRERPAPMLVDVRGADEFRGPLGHIKGAVNIPLQTVLSGPPAALGQAKGPVVLVCRSEMRSAMAARHLAKAGLADVAVLRGGMAGWAEQGLPTA